MTRRDRIQIRVNKDERREAYRIYKTSEYIGTESAFYRDLILGHINHPFYPDDEIDTSIHDTEKQSQKVEGPEENQAHYLAVVIAMHMLRIKLDTDNHKYIKAQPEMFQQLIDQIRGYKFDDKTQLKMPLNSTRRE